MSNVKLNKLCMKESYTMLKTIVRCKHGNLLHSRGMTKSSCPLLWCDGHEEGALGAAGGLPLALFACVANALGALGVIGGLPLAPFVGATDALGPGDALGAEGGLPLEMH
uniref:Uncharacterized protein n=1 Tax=Solanum lycopersicum TaxID=4081 RepID=K4BZ75_SOLLC